MEPKHSLIEDRAGLGFFILEATEIWYQSVVDQIRSHPMVAGNIFFWNAHTGKFKIFIHTGDYKTAKMIADWIFEETLFPGETIENDWGSLLDIIAGVS